MPICQKLPTDFEDKFMQFQHHVTNLSTKNANKFKNIENTCETLCTLRCCILNNNFKRPERGEGLDYSIQKTMYYSNDGHG